MLQGNLLLCSFLDNSCPASVAYSVVGDPRSKDCPIRFKTPPLLKNLGTECQMLRMRIDMKLDVWDMNQINVFHLGMR